MKSKNHIAFMIDFISDFVNCEIDHYFFDLDYSFYVIENFPYMELGNSKLADTKIFNTLDEWLGKSSLTFLY